MRLTHSLSRLLAPNILVCAGKMVVESTTIRAGLSVWFPVPMPALPVAKAVRSEGGFAAAEEPPDPGKAVYCSAKASFLLTQGGKVLRSLCLSVAFVIFVASSISLIFFSRFVSVSSSIPFASSSNCCCLFF